MILFDISPLAGGVGIGIFIFFLLIGAGIALIAYKMLKKSVKTAIRMIIVVAILLATAIGGIGAIWLISSSSKPSLPPIRNTR